MNHNQSIGDGTNNGGAADKTTGGISRLAGLSFGTDEDSFHSQDQNHQNNDLLRKTSKNKSNSKKQQPDPNQTDDTDGMMGELDSYINQKNQTRKSLNTQKQVPRTNTSNRYLTTNNNNNNNRASRNPSNSRQVSNPQDDSLLNDSAAFIISPPSSPEASRLERGPSSNLRLSPSRRTLNSGDPIRGAANHLTLREQEKVIDEVKKENFNLKLKIYFLEDRLAKLAPDQVDLALKENVEIKVEFQTVRQELKRYKRLLLEAERAIELAKTERDELLEQKSLSEERTSSGLQNELKKTRDELTKKDKSIESLESELQRLKDRLERFSATTKEISSNMSSSQARHNNRQSILSQSVDEWSNQEHMMEIKNLKHELTEERQLKEDLIGDNQDLRHRLIETKNALQDTQDEIHRLSRNEEHGYQRSQQISRAQSSRFDPEDRHPDDYTSSGRKSTLTSVSNGLLSNNQQKLIVKEFKNEIEDLSKLCRELEHENIELKSKVNSQIKLLSTKNSEKDNLNNQVINLKRKVLDLQDELDQDLREFQKLQSEGNSGHQQYEQAADEVREELNMYRDKSASALLTLEKREKEIDELNAELDDRESYFNDEIQKLTNQFNSEIDIIKSERDELQEVLDEREDQITELSDQLREVINLQEETDNTLREVRNKLKEKEKDYNSILQDLEAAQTDLKEIGGGNRELAAEVNDKDQQILDLNAELDELEQEASNRATVHEQVIAKLKQKLNSTKTELADLTNQLESSQTEVKFLTDRHEELQSRQSEMEERRRIESDLKRRLERELDDLDRELRSTKDQIESQIIAFKKEKRELQTSFQLSLDSKQKGLAQAESDIAHLKGKLEIREEDIRKLENMLKRVENESNQINQSQSHDKFSLELEIERIQRDLIGSNSEIQSLKEANLNLKNQFSKFQATISSLNSEKDELSDKLEGVQRARDSLNERYEEQTKNLRETQNDLSLTKNRLQSLEDDLASDHLQLNKFEHQYKDQISERNTLLLTIYQYVDKLLNSGSTHRRINSNNDAKPFMNFTVFHESIINRLKSLGAMQSGFDTKIKEVEKKLEKQYTSLKRQHDSRMRQLDQFETTIKAATDTQRQWRARLTTKQGEVEAARETCNELQKQISSLKTRASIAGTSPGSITEQRQALTKINTLEKKLSATQNQLKLTEEKFNGAKVKVSTVESSWQARLKELQDRNKELEEKVKREKKSAKERKIDLDNQVTNLKDQIIASDHRSKQLEELLINQQQKSSST
ncbi:hypothetical protein PSTG_05006 [Puccinia striiformis f. sp. tritici PST-78]|uniref:Centrosomin N-terminal motif 1 domain-containing protein n=1 Tax=Puccinia striiformis f. sp. tritici PST-78 TaxID=1165861 RepID=A0A0L0VRJ3_9BASI|nr:hypothetical protein PSTG_05006 [Puccinia striiformis f. sp. tritici PST-78]